MRKQCMTCVLSWVLAGVLLCGCASKEAEGKEGTRGRQEMESTSSQEDLQGETTEEETLQGGEAGNGSLQGEVELEEVDQEDAEAEKVVFEGQDMEGNVISSDVLSNSRLTMINVWATYCNPCLSEMPGLGQLAAEYDSEDFQLIGIISDVQVGADETAMETAKKLIEQTGADYSHLLLNESLYYALLTDVMAVPTTFFLDEEGHILSTVIGAREKSAWEEIINELLEE